MILNLQIPPYDLHPAGFRKHFLKTAVLGQRLGDFRSQALITNFVRLVELSHISYRNGRHFALSFWEDHTTIAIGDLERSISYFETCITSVDRATRFMRRIRKNEQIPIELRRAFAGVKFATDAAHEQIRTIRNAIHHMDEEVLRGAFQEGMTTALVCAGPEEPVSDPQNPGQVIKTIDRLEVGTSELLFSDLIGRLTEMGDCAHAICEYEPAASGGKA